MASIGLVAVDHVHQLAHDDVPLFGPEEVKGLEFDGVVVVNPHDILGNDSRGARLLYVAMTRAVQELAFVTTGPHPPFCLRETAAPAFSGRQIGGSRETSDLSASDCGARQTVRRKLRVGQRGEVEGGDGADHDHRR